MILEGKSWFVLAGRIPWLDDFGIELGFGFGIRPDAQPGEIRYRFFRTYRLRSPVRLICGWRVNYPVPAAGWYCSTDWTGRRRQLVLLGIEWGWNYRTLWLAR